jgi:hypothetical protein
METLVKQDENLTNTHSFFVSKEHFLSFRVAWRDSIAKGYHERETYTDYKNGVCKRPSKLTATHHLIYNALRKRDLHKSFAPLTRPTKLIAAYNNPYIAFNWARSHLKAAVKWGRTDHLKEPFQGTVNDQMLKELSEALENVKL